jgi:hypothetical protein
MTGAPIVLYDLLPEFLRRVDAEQAQPPAPPPLRALLDAVQSQADLIRADIEKLLENFFVETCDAWLLPYIADLIAVNVVADDAANTRRDVARTIAYRRRKGTVPQLETMARDVTGYDCRLVEFFERLVWNQSMIHFRPDDLATADLRDAGAMGRVGTAFDRVAHTADLRPSTQTHGWYNIRKVGFFFWRLHAIPLRRVEAAAAPAPAPAGRAFHFNALGQPAALFQSPAALERGADADWPRTSELRVVSPISPVALRESPAAFAQTAAGFTLYTNGAPLAAAAIEPANLCQWTEPTPGTVAVDVVLGRILFAGDVAPQATDLIQTDHHVGLSGEIGGGGYERQRTLSPLPGETADLVRVSKAGAVTTISAALATLAGSTAPLRVVQIEDSRTYQEALTLPASFTTLVIQAGNGQRPILDLTAEPTFSGPTAGKQLTVRGLLMTGAGATLVLPAGVETFVFEDCTIDPGGGMAADGSSLRPAGVTVQVPAPGAGVSLRAIRCIVGRLDLPETMECLALSDSIADAQAFPGSTILAAGPPATVLRSTLLGSFHCLRLEASESIFTAVTEAAHRQEGCVRFCYFAPGSRVPRRYQCAPEAPPPVLTSRLCGAPGYAQLALNCPPAIGGGGEDGGEMGVWAARGAPRRMAHLELRLEEYLPAGLVPVTVFVT